MEMELHGAKPSGTTLEFAEPEPCDESVDGANCWMN